MALLVLAYPDISATAREWIQNIRARHDQLYYRVVGPHFTLVFPDRKTEREVFLGHVQQVAKNTAPFRFVLRSAVVNQDANHDIGHVFLVPDEGNSDIIKLHDRLYTGPLAPQLRLEIPFIPHIGIGNSPDLRHCKALVDELNATVFTIAGTVGAIDVVIYDGKTVETIRRLELRGAHGPGVEASDR